MPIETRRQLIVALDFDRPAPAPEMANRLAGVVGMFKIGKQLFTAEGPEAVRQLAPIGLPIFPDLKFHEIPNTVAGAVTACALPGVELLTVHALGGEVMMPAAGRAATSGHPSSANRPKVLAVTLLTGLDAAADQQRIATPAEAMRAGADYLVVGRPIIQASDPAAAAEAIVREMERPASMRA